MPEAQPTATERQPVTYLEAISEALAEEMRRDERVFIIGEDVGAYGGAFGVTKGLYDEFGERRVIDTPISESLIIGAATGAAMLGLRPVAEMQFADFISCHVFAPDARPTRRSGPRESCMASQYCSARRLRWEGTGGT